VKYFEDFQLGEKIITRCRTVTETDIVNFAAISGDWLPLHVDLEYAKQSIFKERIAHGMLILSLSTGLFSPEYIFNKWSFVALYGMEKLRFTSPAKIGDTIYVEMEVCSKKEKEERFGIVDFKYEVKNQNNKVVVACIVKFLINKK
jgi:acyl dehydratase